MINRSRANARVEARALEPAREARQAGLSDCRIAIVAPVAERASRLAVGRTTAATSEPWTRLRPLQSKRPLNSPTPSTMTCKPADKAGRDGTLRASTARLAYDLAPADPDAVRVVCSYAPASHSHNNRSTGAARCSTAFERSDEQMGVAVDTRLSGRTPEKVEARRKDCNASCLAVRAVIYRARTGASYRALFTNTQRGVSYGSQGPERSLIGVTLRVCSRLIIGANAGEANYRSRLASEGPAQMLARLFSSRERMQRKHRATRLADRSGFFGLSLSARGQAQEGRTAGADNIAEHEPRSQSFSSDDGPGIHQRGTA